MDGRQSALFISLGPHMKIMSTSSASLDEALKRIGDIVSSVSTGQPRSSSRESLETMQPALSPSSDSGIQEAIVKEILYSQMIPPLTPSVVMSVYEGIEQFTEDLKSSNQDSDLK